MAKRLHRLCKTILGRFLIQSLDRPRTTSESTSKDYLARDSKAVTELFKNVLGSGTEATHLTVAQVGLRALIVFAAALVMVRMADKRFMAKKTAFDVILSLIIGSMLGRAINGSEQLLPTIVAGFLLVGLHRVLAKFARRHSGFGDLIKGTSETVIRDGKILPESLSRNDLSEDDLLEELRLSVHLEDATDVKHARIDLRTALQDTATPEAKLRALYDKAAASRFDLILAQRSIRAEVEAVLSPEQRGKATELREHRRHRFMNRGLSD